MVVKLIGDREFDVDLICFCVGVVFGIFFVDLKVVVGNCFKEYVIYVWIIEEKKWCWCFNYQGDFYFDFFLIIFNLFCVNKGEFVLDWIFKQWYLINLRVYKVLFDQWVLFKFIFVCI